MKCTDCTYESANEHDFAYTSTDRMTEPRCMTCFIPAVERRMKNVENTLHKKSCILCWYKGLPGKDLFSISSAPLKLVCKSCIDVLHILVVKEKVDAELR